MTQIPPSRYKVIEQGRRLVVIDTHTGVAVERRASNVSYASLDLVAPEPAAPRPPAPEAVTFRPVGADQNRDRLPDNLAQTDRMGLAPSARPIQNPRPGPIHDHGGAQIITTIPLFDNKAPRRFRLDQQFQDTFAAPLVAVVAILVVSIILAFMLTGLVLLILPYAVFRYHAAFRKWTTAQLDELDQLAP